MVAFRVWRHVVLLCVFVFCGGCGAAPSSQHAGPQGQAAQPPRVAANADALGAAGGVPVTVERKIISTSRIDVVVEDMEVALQQLQKLYKPIQDSGGYLARQEVSGSKGHRRESSWTIRVPLAKFDGFVADLEAIGELQQHLREAQDVTDAYADLDARLRNKQSSEKRLLSHLDRTGELKDTLEVERELSRVRGEIEQLQGQLNLLKNKTDLATVIVTLHEIVNYTPATAPTFSTEISRTFDASCKSLIAMSKGFLLVAVGLTPWLAVAVVFVVPTLLIRRRRLRV